MDNIKKIFTKTKEKIAHVNKSYQAKIEKKPLKYVFQFLPHNIVLLLLTIALFTTFVPQLSNNLTGLYMSPDTNEVVEPIINKAVTGTFKGFGKVKEFDNIAFRFATYARTNNSIYKFEFFIDKKLVYSKEFNAKILDDGGYYNFKVGNVKVDKNKRYSYKITPIKVKDGLHAITFYNDNKTNNPTFMVSIVSSFHSAVIVISCIFIMMFFAINYLVNTKKITKERSFLLLMLSYILPILFIYPPFEVPDEVYHFYRAYNISDYNFSKSPAKNLTDQKTRAPKNMKCLFYADPTGRDSVKNSKQLTDCMSSEKNVKYTMPQTMDNNNFVSYIPSAIAIKIADTFSNSPIIIFYAGRLCNLFLSLLIILYALKIIPIFKKQMLLIVCIPMFIQQMISYSYDSLLNACCLLLIAYVIKFIKSKAKITNKQLITYGLLSLVVFVIKYPYAIISLLIFAVPKDRFKGELKEKLIKLSLIGLCIFIVHFILKYIVSIGYVAPKMPPNRSGNQLGYILKHPLELPSIVYRTFDMLGTWYLHSMIGVFGWLKFKLPNLFVISYLVMLFLSSRINESILKIKQKLVFLGIVAVIFSGIFAAMYFGWSTYRLPYIEGVQGRYFIPLLLPLLLVIMPKKNKLKMKDETIYQFINIMFIAFIITILVSFY